MGTQEEEDWRKVEQDCKNREEKIKAEYGVDITKLKMVDKKTQKKIEKINKNLEKALKGFFIAIGIVYFLILLYVRSMYLNLQDRMDVNFIERLKEIYDAKFKIEKELDVDEKGNGLYLVKTDDKRNFEFLVYKDGGQYTDDYASRSLKYYFEAWNNENKSMFEVQESVDEKGIIDYRIIAKVNEISKIDIAVNSYIDLINSAGEYYLNNWLSLISHDGYTQVILPNPGETAEYNINLLKREDVVWHIRNNVEISSLTEEEKEKYARPSFFTEIYIDGEKKELSVEKIIFYVDGEYKIPISIFEFIPGATIKIENGQRVITYKGKTYKEGKKEDLSKNIVLYSYEIDKFNEIFGTNIYYDYNTLQIRINTEDSGGN